MIERRRHDAAMFPPLLPIAREKPVSESRSNDLGALRLLRIVAHVVQQDPFDARRIADDEHAAKGALQLVDRFPVSRGWDSCDAILARHAHKFEQRQRPFRRNGGNQYRWRVEVRGAYFDCSFGSFTGLACVLELRPHGLEGKVERSKSQGIFGQSPHQAGERQAAPRPYTPYSRQVEDREA
jgi:hypothetical protein